MGFYREVAHMASNCLHGPTGGDWQVRFYDRRDGQTRWNVTECRSVFKWTTHLSLEGRTGTPRIEPSASGALIARPRVGGLHHCPNEGLPVPYTPLSSTCPANRARERPLQCAGREARAPKERERREWCYAHETNCAEPPMAFRLRG